MFQSHQHLNLLDRKQYSRKAINSWFGSKNKAFEIVNPGEVGAKRNVPDFIKKPSYADSGVEFDSEKDIQILDRKSVGCMRKSCSLARIVLDEVARYIEV